MKSIAHFFRRFSGSGKPTCADVSSPGGLDWSRKKRKLAIALGAMLAVMAGYLATAGVSWSQCFHPDENRIAKWIDQVLDKGYITDRAYPSGWFELFRIQVWWEKQADKIARHWQEHAIQNGRVSAVHEWTFSQYPVSERKGHGVQDGRNFNAWLYVFACVFLYAACLEAGFHPWAAFVSALFFLAAAPPLEFLHYCETDEGVVLGMAFFAWLSARSIRKKSVVLAVLGGFAAGFAIACKFTLFPLLLWCFPAPAVVLRRHGDKRWTWFAGRSVLSLACLGAAAAGYLAGTPALRLAPEWYREALLHASNGTYAEIRINLGGDYSWNAASVLRAGSLVRELGSWGVLPILWGVFAWTFWFRRRFRRQAMGIPVLLPVFIPFLVCCCPFVRRQELLPLSILLAMGAGLPLEWLLTGGKETRGSLRGKRGVAVAVAALAGLVAFGAGLRQTLGMSSCFSVRDTRVEAQNWLHDACPAAEPVAFDSYVGQVARGVDCRAISMRGLPFYWRGLPTFRGTNAAPVYYVENVGFEARYPIRSQRTSALLPDVRERVADYQASTFPLRTWSVSRSISSPTFGQPEVRLVSFEPPAPTAFDVPIGHGRPVLVLPDGAQLYDADGVAGLGAFRGIHTVGKRTSVHLKLEDGRRWMVTRMLEGTEPVWIVREGLFRPEKSALPPGGAVAAALRPGLWERFASRVSAYSSMRCRMRGDDQTIVCASFVVSTPAEAARELRLGGDAEGALKLLRDAGTSDDESRVEAFLAATAAKAPVEGEWADAARRALAAWDRFAAEKESLGRTGATFCGVPAGALCDFARTRLGRRMVSPGLRLPVYLPPGRYEVGVPVQSRQADPPLLPRLFEGQTEDFRQTEEGPGRWLFTAPLEVTQGRMLRVVGNGGEELFSPFVSDVTISWSPMERTGETAEAIRSAFGD